MKINDSRLLEYNYIVYFHKDEFPLTGWCENDLFSSICYLSKNNCVMIWYESYNLDTGVFTPIKQIL